MQIARYVREKFKEMFGIPHGGLLISHGHESLTALMN